MFGEGISKMSELLDVGVKLGIVQKSGAWFNYGVIRLGQGRDNAKQFLMDNPEIANDIEGQIRANAVVEPCAALLHDAQLDANVNELDRKSVV